MSTFHVNKTFCLDGPRVSFICLLAIHRRGCVWELSLVPELGTVWHSKFRVLQVCDVLFLLGWNANHGGLASEVIIWVLYTAIVIYDILGPKISGYYNMR